MNIVVLDAATLGEDLSLEPLKNIGECKVYQSTSPEDVAERIANCDVVVLNKIKLNSSNLPYAKNLKLICLAATGYDNVDISYCTEHGIGVCNVEGYSSHSVSQLTIAMVLSLSTHLSEYNRFVTSGDYTRSGLANRLVPVYNELCGKKWGIVGFGGIGREVGRVAEALGCELLVCKRHPVEGYNCVDIDTLCREADIITIHTPLTDSTKHLIDNTRLHLMKKSVILVNAARGLVTDENAVAEAVKNGAIGAFGTDVYSVEPFGKEHPFFEIKDYPNVCLTPHMAWGAFEARRRCLDEIVCNIREYFAGGSRNRVDLI